MRRVIANIRYLRRDVASFARPRTLSRANSASTSAVCSPSIGAPRYGPVAASENLIGSPSVSTVPSALCSTGTTIRRAVICGWCSASAMFSTGAVGT